MSKVTVKFQITIPPEVRDAMQIVPGTEIVFKRDKDKFYIVKEVRQNPFDKWRGALKFRRKTDAILAELRGYGFESLD
ncbi:MAG: AbrB/MazE/SpoVT family DNA-binding domain-containing protein [Deltaproteobacteria bacterium]|nr:AbrB/MazE/SpoVT family DNA-binding domain-containing protein [Deltaproteobacteria bacterium]MBW2154405.1 AbrB/MazE/SpoVT family DNA-binding domain-containing protein [Deltaproteobacteria bacterium]